MTDEDFTPFGGDLSANLPDADEAPQATPAAEPKKRGRPRKADAAPAAPAEPVAAVTARSTVNEAAIPGLYVPDLDPHAPPLFVRHRKTGVVTRWTPIFRSRVNEFDVFYRPGSTDAADHRAAVARADAIRALTGGTMLAGARGMFESTNIGG